MADTREWKCQYVDAKGASCENEALFRLHFSPEHPFDHVDVCMLHSEEYKYYAWFQLLRDFRIPKQPSAGEEP